MNCYEMLLPLSRCGLLWFAFVVGLQWFYLLVSELFLRIIEKVAHARQLVKRVRLFEYILSIILWVNTIAERIWQCRSTISAMIGNFEKLALRRTDFQQVLFVKEKLAYRFLTSSYYAAWSYASEKHLCLSGKQLLNIKVVKQIYSKQNYSPFYSKHAKLETPGQNFMYIAKGWRRNIL